MAKHIVDTQIIGPTQHIFRVAARARHDPYRTASHPIPSHLAATLAEPELPITCSPAGQWDPSNILETAIDEVIDRWNPSGKPDEMVARHGRLAPGARALAAATAISTPARPPPLTGRLPSPPAMPSISRKAATTGEVAPHTGLVFWAGGRPASNHACHEDMTCRVVSLTVHVTMCSTATECSKS